MEIWKPYLIAMAVGLLVGIERENSASDQKALGVRTFLLLSLLGAISGGLANPWLSGLITALVFSLILISYFIPIYSKPEKFDLGLTTEFAGIIVYVVGYLAHSSPILAATIGPIVAIILFSKASLHHFTASIKPAELKAAIIILIVAAVVIDLAPNSAIDPWGFVNPRKFGYLVLTLACLEFLSYISYKYIGEKKSSLVVGLLGGIVSSTVVLISSAQQASRDETKWRNLAVTALAAQLASMLELLLIVYLISPVLLIQVAYATVPLIIFGGVSLFILSRQMLFQNVGIELKSPLDWKGIIRLSVIFTLVLALISAAEHWFGKEATIAISFLTGLFELQAISLANATLFVQNQVDLHVAIQCIVAAIVASLVSKIAISWILSRNKFAICLTAVFGPMIGILLLVTSWVLSAH